MLFIPVQYGGLSNALNFTETFGKVEAKGSSGK